jgi:hypothetical protein
MLCCRNCSHGAATGAQEAMQGKEESTHPEPPAPDRGAPVSPSPRRGTATEKDRWAKARLAVMRGRAVNWRSMVDEFVMKEV